MLLVETMLRVVNMVYFSELKFIPFDYLVEFVEIAKPIRQKYYSKKSLIMYLSRSLSKREINFIFRGFKEGQNPSVLAHQFLLTYGTNGKLISNLLYDKIRNGKILNNYLGKEFSIKSEFWFSNSRADLAVFDGTSVGIEIKSDRDNFSRLKKQLNDYHRFFEYVFVVIPEDNREQLLDFLDTFDSIPGIMTYSKAKQDLAFHMARKPRKSKIDGNLRSEELTRKELIELLKEKDFDFLKLKSKKKSDLIREFHEIGFHNANLEIDHIFMKRYL